MRAEAIEPVQFQFERKGRAHQQAAQGGLAHLQRVLELHVAAHGFDDLLDLFAGKPEPLQNLLGHVRADLLVAVEMHAARLRVARKP